MGKATYWITLAVVMGGIVLARRGVPEFHLSDAFGLAFIGLIIYWISRPSARHKNATDRQREG